MEGGNEEVDHSDKTEDDSDEWVLQKWYDIEEGSFLDPPQEFLKQLPEDDRYCPCCDREAKKEKYNSPEPLEKVEEDEEGSDETKEGVKYKKVMFKGEEFSVGDCVYIHPNAYKYKKKAKAEAARQKRDVLGDEEKYPELYRKTNEYIKGSNVNIAEPYRIGCILAIV